MSHERSEPTPPQSFDAESAILGAILCDPEVIDSVVEVLPNESYFYHPKHKHIYKAMLSLYSKSEPSDITTVAEMLESKSKLEGIGGRVYLVTLAEYISSTVNVVHHAKIVQGKFLARDLIATSTKIVKNCYNSEFSPEQLIEDAEQSIFKLSESQHQEGFRDMKELVSNSLIEIDQMQENNGNPDGIHTGFIKIDELIPSLNGGELIIIAGRPSMGKTSLALNIADNIAVSNNPKNICIFSIEMPSKQLVFRMLCSRAKLDQQRVRNGNMKDKEWIQLTDAGESLSKASIFIDESATLTIQAMRAKARKLKVQQDIDMIIVDYIQLMDSPSKSENRQQEMTVISRGLKSIAKELNVPVIALSQLSRQVEQRGGVKRPQLSDLRESGAIEQDADIVMFIYRPEFYLSHLDKTSAEFTEVEGQAEIIIAKHRNGPTGTANLAFLKELASFRNLAYNQ